MRRSEVVAVVLCGLNLGFMLGFARYSLKPPAPVEYAVTQFVALFTLPLVARVKRFADSTASRASRFQYTLVTIAAVGFLAWFAEWNLLRYRF